MTSRLRFPDRTILQTVRPERGKRAATRTNSVEVLGGVLLELGGAARIAEVVGGAVVFAGCSGSGRIHAHAADRILGERALIVVGSMAATARVHAFHTLVGVFLLGFVITEQSHDESFLTVVVVIIIVRVRLTNLIRLTKRLVWIEQAQSARIRHHAQRRERHGSARDHRIEHHAGERVEHARRNGNADAVVAKSESKILRDIAHGGMGQIKRMHQTHQRAVHQCHVRGLDRHIRACSNGESHIRTGQVQEHR